MLLSLYNFLTKIFVHCIYPLHELVFKKYMDEFYLSLSEYFKYDMLGYADKPTSYPSGISQIMPHTSLFIDLSTFIYPNYHQY